MAEPGIFLDILARLNLASVDRVLKDVNTAMREGGRSSGRAFSEGFRIDGAAAQFRELTEASERAFRDMQSGLDNLRIQESRINDMRVNKYRHTMDEMIAAQKEFDAALANSMKLQEVAAASRSNANRGREEAAAAADTAAWRRGTYDPAGRSSRGVPIPLGRGANIAGAGALIAGAGGAFESGRIAMDVQGNLNQVQAQQRDTTQNIRLLTDSVWRLAQQTGYSPKEISKSYGGVERATNYVTGQGYRGQDAVDVMQNATMMARTTGGGLDEAIQAITTTSHDYRIGIDKAAALLTAGFADIKGSMDDFANSLHSIEPIAQQAGIGPNEIIAALQQASQTGQTAQQSAPNLANLIKGLAGGRNGTQAKALGQLGLDPQDISDNFSSRGLAGTLGMVQQAILKKMGPDGNINLGYAYQNQLETQQQEQDFDQLSPQVQALLKTPKFQDSAVGGTSKQLSKAFSDAGVQIDADTIPIVSDWLKKQKELNGPASNIRSNKPEIQNILGAYSSAFGGSDAGRMGMMLSGSPALLDQFKGREQSLGEKATPDAFSAAFKEAMESDANKFKKLGASAEALAGKMGEHLLPILGRAADDLNGFVDFLDRNKTAMNVFTGALVTIGGAYGFVKIVNGIEALTGAINTTITGAGKAGEFLSKIATLTMPNFNAVATGADKFATAENVAAGEVSTAGTEVAAAGTAGMRLTTAEDEAAIKMGAAGIIPGAPIAPGGPVPAGKPGWFGRALKFLPGIGTALVMGDGQEDANRQRHPEEYGPDGAPKSPGQLIDQLPKKGWARGGIAGYDNGTDAVDPYSQPLMGQPDMLRDSLLGMLPGGKPVGLRGGEGILTPGAVQRLGGKSGIDSLNAGEDPWANPTKVGTTFFGSFAKGVAKYSKWGKYLTAASQSIDSLTGASETAEGEHQGRGPSRTTLEEMLMGGMSPEQMESMGIHRGKRGGLMAADGSYLPNPGGSRGRGGGIGNQSIQSWLGSRLLASGLSPDEARGILAMNQVEGGASSQQSLLGFTEGQASGPEGHLQAFLNQWNDPSRRQDGQIPGVGAGGRVTDPNAYMTWIRQRIVGQNGAASDWQGNRQPNPQDYQNGLMNAWGQNNGGWAGYSGGGIVGYADGGRVNPGDYGRGADGDPLPPPWWSNGSGKIPIDNAWMPNAGGVEGKLPWISPSHLRGRGGISGFSGGGQIPLDPAPQPTPPLPAPPPIRPPQQGAGPKTAVDQRQLPFVPGMTGGKPLTGPTTPPPGLAGTPPPPPKTGMNQLQQQGIHLGAAGTEPGTYPKTVGDRGINENTSRQAGMGNSSKGFGVQGGVLGMAEGAASMAANAFAPGAGQASNMAFQLLNRAIGYGGQLVGIGLSGLMETFLPNNSPLADPSNNILGKAALGIAGAHKSPQNSAGNSAMQLQPKEGLDPGAQGGGAKSVLPMVHMDHPTINNHGDQDWGGMHSAINQALFGAVDVGHA